ncbi:uncharacterized protein LOC132205167 [Neocloeon triangulifer]|uniref:uncharacterized protein LOC132205167 n=1 Tax=Neocloeon triangulifer TaxID=2078957 RepID=UPI00286F0B59|nr:uncharacterized protein LOC132205167 [Neocloeon triangulifer]XP_059490062.1 uncharacterized protein LOC132205167 [Neocloeon triangulifer]XP_059490063.1 uncharacterized protein LOC132205167 [Neocloeon triangulifer]
MQGVQRVPAAILNREKRVQLKESLQLGPQVGPSQVQSLSDKRGLYTVRLFLHDRPNPDEQIERHSKALYTRLLQAKTTAVIGVRFAQPPPGSPLSTRHLSTKAADIIKAGKLEELSSCDKFAAAIFNGFVPHIGQRRDAPLHYLYAIQIRQPQPAVEDDGEEDEVPDGGAFGNWLEMLAVWTGLILERIRQLIWPFERA